MHATAQLTALNTVTSLNSGYQHVFKPDQLTPGLVLPLESYAVQSLPLMVMAGSLTHGLLLFSNSWCSNSDKAALSQSP